MGSPVTPVLVGLAIVLGVGFWAMNGSDTPASGKGEKAAQTAKKDSTAGTGSASGTGGTSGTGSAPGTGGTSGTGSTSGTGGSAGASTTKPPSQDTTAPKTEAATPASTQPPTAAASATLEARQKIDRSGGSAKTMLVTVYYSDGLKDGLSLQPVEIKVAQSDGRIRATAEQIVNAPQDLKLYSNVPAGTKVLGANLKDGVAIVDLSAEAAKIRGSAAVNSMMASFVYSLTAIPNVKAVQLWVNGKPALLDGIEWSKPLSRADMDARNLFKVEPVVKYSGS